MRRLGLVLLVALVFALTGPVTAGAQLQTFGSTLASPSNLAFGCEAVPTIVDVGGPAIASSQAIPTLSEWGLALLALLLAAMGARAPRTRRRARETL